MVEAMPEINPCRELGCPAACCRNIHGQMPVSKEFFLKAFPDAWEVFSEKETVEKIKNQEHGVYCFPDRGWIYFSISGDCPNLREDLSCLIHGSRFYPRFCTNMGVKSIDCYDSQEIFKLNSICFKLGITG